jgi:hypothetical protein
LRRSRPLVSAGTATLLVIAVVVIGLVAVALTSSGGDTTHTAGSGGDPSSRALPPRAPDAALNQPGDHWHTYFAINICGEWLPPAAQFEKPYDDQQSQSNVGIHTHGDGLIHVHPFVTSETGDNATLGLYLRYVGWQITPETVDVSSGYPEPGPASDPNRRVWRTGDACTFGDFKDQPGEVVWSVDGEVQAGNPSDYKLEDGETIVIGFLPEGAQLGFPPDACTAFATIYDGAASVLSPRSPCRTQATPTTAQIPTTAPPSTSTPPAPSTDGTVYGQSCVFQHEPGSVYVLAQPVTITLPDGRSAAIIPGNPITQPGGVTLDADGSSPGLPGSAASLLWGAATDRGPFSGLDRAVTGEMITLRQDVPGYECTQQWRIVRVFTPPSVPSSERPLLRLVGFTPQGASGPNVQFYVDAVPA